MKNRRVSREEAERAYSTELAGNSVRFADRGDAIVEAVHLSAKPTPGGSRGKGFLPLTYEYSLEGSTHTHITRDGPEVDELRAFLQATLDDLEIDQRVQLWFENGHTPESGCC